MNRIFLLGDSFTENLYQTQLFYKKMGVKDDSQIRKYIDIIFSQTGEYPMYFDEWLKFWGYDVFNFGLGACSIYHTFNQFAKIEKQFQKGDRLVVGWTSPQRLDWITDSGGVQIIQGAYNNYKDKRDVWEVLQQQDINRADSLDNRDGVGYIRKETIPFMSKLVDLHSIYNPIQWSPFANVSDIFSKERWYMYEPANLIFRDCIPEFDKLLIETESDGVCEDRHYGRYGNYYLALILKTIFEYKKVSDGYYTKDNNLLDTIFKVIANNPPKFKKIDWKRRLL